MGGIVEAAFWGIVSQLMIYLVLLPMGLILLGCLIFILAATLRELWKQRRK